MRRRLARLLADGADAVQVACALGVRWQRVQALIEEFQRAPAPCAVPMERGSGVSASAVPSATQAWPAGGPSGGPPSSPANAGSPESVIPVMAEPDEPAAIPVVTPLQSPPPARPFCRYRDHGPPLPLSRAVLDALGIELAPR